MSNYALDIPNSTSPTTTSLSLDILSAPSTPAAVSIIIDDQQQRATTTTATSSNGTNMGSTTVATSIAVSAVAAAIASGTGPTVTAPIISKPPNGARQGSAHIHLWQFLKELLSSPQNHGSAIRWLDRSKGVFKIEGSVRVARLWGRRKNRPAMNYDKLSRSIRQYYKKGIMKKTERSQRLVYQFCHPYAM